MAKKVKSNKGSDFNAREFADNINNEAKSDFATHMEKVGETLGDEDFETIVSAAEFWKFEKKPVFSGVYIRPVIREKDSDVNPEQKAGDVMGFLFVDDEGIEHIVGASATIKKGIEGIHEGDKLRITYMGKTQNAKKQPVNKFIVQRYKKK